ncbi:MAG TPA: hypothetical protein VMG41_03790 [Gemmatimonadales bacterium]|nr:hypothetical protein [Gemmatimonadales bacterium]
MPRAAITTLTLMLTAGLAAGCHHRPPPQMEANPQGGEVGIQIVNHNFSDMDVFALENGGYRVRLGQATGKATSVFVVPWRHLSTSGTIRLLAVPIGGTGRYTTGLLSVRPGSIVILTLEDILDQSSVSIF